ncbi:MAG: hypothetical protein BWZ10_02240 [candidate division BRC1 bacterium ADurb.BinA364]|nr:MAG: hypothetical protein BWZ10_02240 [candidate division BRC1 bacterium ADurb.BinA364]
MPQRPGEIHRIDPDFQLIDDRLAVRIEEFDRVLDGDDVLAAGQIDLLDDRRQSGGLAAARGAGDKDQAVAPKVKIGDGFRQFQRFGAGRLQVDLADGQTGRAALMKDIDAETRLARQAVGEIHRALLFVGHAQAPRHDVVHDGLGFLRPQRRIIDRAQRAVEPEHRRAANLEVQVRGVGGDHSFEQRGQVERHAGISVLVLKSEKNDARLCKFARHAATLSTDWGAIRPAHGENRRKEHFTNAEFEKRPPGTKTFSRQEPFAHAREVRR